MLKENIDITNLSNFKTKCKTRYFYHFTGYIDELKKILEFAKKNNLKKFFVGGGTNMFFAFDYFDGIVISIDIRGFKYDKKTKKLELGAGEYVWDIAEKLEKEYKNNLWHRFIGLPGTVGGAVYGNAGCFGLETANNFEKCDVFDLETKQIKTFSNQEMNFSYRSSRLKKERKYILLKAYFDLSKKIEKYHSDADVIYFRKNKQPKGNTCGSFFKNSSKENSAGKLIEEVGLKGYKLGTAYFSSLHANFLMSEDNGNYKDLLQLIDLAKKKVKEKFGIILEEEVNIIKID